MRVGAIWAGLVLAAVPLCAAAADKAQGAITGRIVNHEATVDMQILAWAEDNTIYTANVGSDGRYRIDDLPRGTYKLSGWGCAEMWPIGKVVVAKAEVAAPDAKGPDCGFRSLGPIRKQ